MKLLLLLLLMILNCKFALAKVELDQIISPLLIEEVSIVAVADYPVEIRLCQWLNFSKIDFESGGQEAFNRDLNKFEKTTQKLCVKTNLKPNLCTQREALQACYQNLQKFFRQMNIEPRAVASRSLVRKTLRSEFETSANLKSQKMSHAAK